MSTHPDDHLASEQHLDFDVAEIETLESFPPQHVLRVAGVAPHADTTVELRLEPRPAGPYRRVEVVGFLRGTGRRRPGPYEVRLALPEPGGGQRGIEVVGATRRERLELPASESSDVVEEYDPPGNGWTGPGERAVPTEAAALRGVVRDSSSWPLPGARVTARPAHRAPRPDDPVTRTDADGRYQLRHPAPEVVRVEARIGGFHPAAGETRLDPGRTGRVDLHLAPLAGVSVEVVEEPPRSWRPEEHLGGWEVVEGSE
jgi:hypothetical protein